MCFTQTGSRMALNDNGKIDQFTNKPRKVMNNVRNAWVVQKSVTRLAGCTWTTHVHFYIANTVSGHAMNELYPESITCAFNTLRPKQYSRHLPDDIFKCIFLNENISISISISLKFLSKGPINNVAALVQIMAWRRPGYKPLSEPTVVRLLTHICVTRPPWVNEWCHEALITLWPSSINSYAILGNWPFIYYIQDKVSWGCWFGIIGWFFPQSFNYFIE